jgi:hypothetical protein
MTRRKIDHRIWTYKHRAWRWTYLRLRVAQHFAFDRLARYAALRIDLRRKP